MAQSIHRVVLANFCLLIAFAAQAQYALLRDINRTVTASSTTFGNQPAAAKLGDGFIFAAESGEGCDPWIAGDDLMDLRRIKAIGSCPQFLIAAGSRVFFEANNGANLSIWVTDGTEAGTVAVPTPAKPLFTGHVAVLGDSYYFEVVNGDLWKTDGTPSGTSLVAAIGSVGPTIRPVRVGEWLYYVGYDADHGHELWRTDGVSTVRVVDINAGTGSSMPNRLAAMGDKLFFAADDGTNGYQLFVTDGTEAGTVALAPMNTTDPVVPAGSDVFYFTRQPGVSVALWRTDGTPGAATSVYTWPYSAFVSPYAGSHAGYAYYRMGSATGANEFWSSDGTESGTVRLLEDTAVEYVPFGDALYFRGGFSLWRTQGTVASTVMVIPSSSSGGGAAPLFATSTRIAVPFGGTLSASDGTLAGTTPALVMAGEPSVGSGGCGKTSTSLNGEVYFFAKASPVPGCQLWKTNGTPAGTTLVRDISPYSAYIPDIQSTLESANGFVFFSVIEGANQGGLWRSDGTSAGTVRIASFSAASGAPRPLELKRMGNAIYFIQGGDATTRGLWRSDGTPAGTTRLYGGGVNYPSPIVTDNLVFFTGGSPGALDLWRTDGTAAGTIQLRTSISIPFGMMKGGSTLVYFSTSSQLWSSDGTVAGTKAVSTSVTLPSLGATSGDLLLFKGTQSGSESLFVTRGTAATTVRIGNDPSTLIAIGGGGKIYFRGSNGHLWKTDGTTAGTVDLTPGLGIQDGIFAIPGAIFFRANEAATGPEIYVSNGATPGATRVAEFAPGVGGMFASPATFANVAGGIFLREATTRFGEEPYFLALDSSPDPFTFASRENIALNAVQVSDPVLVSGMVFAANAVSTSGEVCVSSAANCSCDLQPFGASRPVNFGQYLCARHTSSNRLAGSVTTSVNIGGVIGTFTSTTIPGPALAQFTAANATVTEGQTLSLTVTRTGVATESASVNWQIGGGTGVPGEDYPSTFAGIVNWAAGDTTNRTIELAIPDDILSEPTKTWSIALFNPVGVALGNPNSVAVTLLDNDPGIAFTKTQYNTTEGAGSVTLQVVRTGNLAGAASVKWATVNGQAVAGQDFGTKGTATQRTGTLSWVAGDGSAKSISIPIIQDIFSEGGGETFTVALSMPAGGALGPVSSATVLIADDDPAPESVISFVTPKLAILENQGNAVLTLHRGLIPVVGTFTMAASVSYSIAPGTATATSDYSSRTGTITWAAGDTADKTISIPLANNTVAEGPESFTVTIVPTSAGVLVDQPTATVVILDDDEVFPKFGAIPDGWVVPAGATKGWHASNDAGAFEGVFALRSDQIEDSQAAQVEFTKTFAAGNIMFRVKVSSELNFDKLRFFVDGVEKGSWSGTANTAWQVATVPVTAGPHTIRWSYEKDGSGSIGSDAAWIDAVVLP